MDRDSAHGGRASGHNEFLTQMVVTECDVMEGTTMHVYVNTKYKDTRERVQLSGEVSVHCTSHETKPTSDGYPFRFAVTCICKEMDLVGPVRVLIPTRRCRCRDRVGLPITDFRKIGQHPDHSPSAGYYGPDMIGV